MGYRSSGACRVRGPKEQVLGVLARLRFLGNAEVNKQLTETVSLQRSGENHLVIGFDIQDWKWYDSYPDVQALEAIWGAFQEAQQDTAPDLNGAFVRIGEDDGDTETRYFGDGSYELVQVNRGWDTDEPLEPEKNLMDRAGELANE
jgi:hypothetical protein